MGVAGVCAFFQFSLRKAFASCGWGCRIAIPAERGRVVMRPAGRSQNIMFVIGFFVDTNQGFFDLLIFEFVLEMIFLENRLQYQHFSRFGEIWVEGAAAKEKN